MAVYLLIDRASREIINVLHSHTPYVSSRKLIVIKIGAFTLAQFRTLESESDGHPVNADTLARRSETFRNLLQIRTY